METRTETEKTERQIMPKDLLEHYIEARANGYASGKKAAEFWFQEASKFKRYKFHGDTPYYYQDYYYDREERPGNFGGFEINSEYAYDGEKLTFYVYGGGLTNEGLALGEEAVYSRLQKFLAEHIPNVRFGKKNKFEFEDGAGIWVYEGDGEIGDWGWNDKERIIYNGQVVYELVGTGLCFTKGF